MLHRDLLANSSPYFSSLLDASKTTPTSSPPSTELFLSSTNPKVFRIAMDHLYLQRLPVFSFPTAGPLNEKRWDDWNDLLLDLSIFATRYNLQELADAVFDLFFNTHARFAHEDAYLLPDDATLARACAGLPETSPMLRFLADLVAQILHDEDVQKKGIDEADLPKAFVQQVKARVEERSKRGGELSVRFDACEYHTHAVTAATAAMECERKLVREWVICG